ESCAENGRRRPASGGAPCGRRADPAPCRARARPSPFPRGRASSRRCTGSLVASVVVAVLLPVFSALLLFPVVLVGRRRGRWRRRRQANDLAADLLYGCREVQSVPLRDEPAIDRLHQLVSEPVRFGERPTVISALEQPRHFVAAARELARDGSLDRRRGAGLGCLAAAPPEKRSTDTP